MHLRVSAHCGLTERIERLCSQIDTLNQTMILESCAWAHIRCDGHEIIVRVANYRSIAVPHCRVTLSRLNCRGKMLLVMKGFQADRGYWHVLLVRRREGDRWAEYFAGRHKTEGPSRRRKAHHIYPEADRPSAAVLAAPKPLFFPSTLQTTNRRYPSTPRTSEIGLGAPSGHWSLVSSYLTQQDHYCAPRKSPHRVEDISYCGRGLQAETAMLHRLHGVFHDPERRSDIRLSRSRRRIPGCVTL